MLHSADSVIAGGRHRVAHLGLRGRDEGAGPLVGGCAEYQRRRGAALPAPAAPLVHSPRAYLRKAQPHETGQGRDEERRGSIMPRGTDHGSSTGNSCPRQL